MRAVWRCISPSMPGWKPECRVFLGLAAFLGCFLGGISCYAVMFADRPLETVHRGNEWRQARSFPAGEKSVCALGPLPERAVVRLGILTESTTGGVTVTAEAGDAQAGQWTVPAGEGWHDERLDLSGCGETGKPIRLIFESKEPYWVGPCEVASPALSKPNILFYVIDTVRLDHLGCYGYARPTSPHLDAFAKDCVRFTQMVPQSSWTRPSLASFLTSTYPNEHGAVDYPYPIRPGIPRLASSLAAAGYETHGITSSMQTLPLFGFAEGFFRYVDVEAMNMLVMDPAKTVDAAIDTMRRAAGRSWFMFVHSMGAHEPYTPPEEYAARFRHQDTPATPEALKTFLESCDPAPPTFYTLFGVSGDLRRDVPKTRPLAQAEPCLRRLAVDLYDAKIAYHDVQFQRMIDALKANGMYDNTIIMVVSDHGEEFCEHGQFSHGGTLYEEVLRVPFLVKLPNQAHAGRRVDSVVEGVDIAPTLLQLAGLPPEPRFQGRSFVDLIEGGERDEIGFASLNYRRPGGAERAAKIPGLKYIYNIADNREECYDLESDPGEYRSMALSPQAVRLKEHARQLSLRGRSGLHIYIKCALEPLQAFRGTVRSNGIRAFEFFYSDGTGHAERSEGMVSFQADMQDLKENIFAKIVPKPPWQDIHLSIAIDPSSDPAIDLRLNGQPVPQEAVRFGPNREHCELNGSVLPLARLTTMPGRYNPAVLPDAFGVYVWYVPEVEGPSGKPLDNDMKEKLRSLGYVD